MEIIKHLFKVASFIFLILIFSGCSSTEKNTNKPKNKVNLISIENKADIAYMSGHLEMAEALYRELLQTRNDYAPAWFRLGNIYTRTNRLNAAVSAYQNCLQNNNEHERAWHNLAITRIRQATEVLINSQDNLVVNSPTKDKMEILFIELMRLQTQKKPSKVNISNVSK